ncbi:acyltransferase family protein, partial [Sphingomonas sp. ACRSK]|uniref:acyltransferase family protein n=1 Tax=Sphingomonas sp. ACRSK TaxID=2918213 RepID=UPI001EF6BCD2
GLLGPWRAILHWRIWASSSFLRHYDEAQILLKSQPQICAIGADGGHLITMHSRQLRSVLAEMNAPTRLVLWVVALAGLAKGPANTMYVPSLAEFALTIMNTAAASLLIILSIVEGRGMVFLLGRVPVFIGRISFSLYLVHMPVIAASVHSLPASWPLLARVVFGVVASVPVAVAFYEIVEHPSGKLSRRIGDHISKLQSPHKSRS